MRIILCFILSILTFNGICVRAECNTVPVSLSGFSHCEDNTCYFSQTALVDIPIADSSEACMEFISPSNSAVSSSVNISLDRAHLLWDPNFSIDTDSPAVSAIGHCGCPGGNTWSCPYIELSLLYRDVILCLSGTHNSDECFLSWSGVSGTWALSIGLAGSDRFKTTNWKQTPTKDFSVTVGTRNATFSADYHGTPVYYNHLPSFINVTVLSDTHQVDFIPEYTLFDRAAPSDWYFFGSDDVNGLDEYDMNKIGWFKAGILERLHQIEQEVDVRLEDCNDNRFFIQYPWFKIEDRLAQRRQYLSRAMYPNSYLIDSEFEPSQEDQGSVPNHSIEPYYYMKNGWMLEDMDGDVRFVGITMNDEFVPRLAFNLDFDETEHIDITTNQGLKTFTNTTLRISGFDGYFKSVSGEEYYGTINFVYHDPSKAYGICMYFQSNSTRQCVNVTFVTTIFPSGRKAILTFDGAFKQQILTTGNSTAPKLITEASNGVLSLLVEFKNMTITFESTNVKPRINSVKISNDTLIVNAQSVTAGGDCMIGTNPADLLITQPIALSVTPKDFEVTLHLTKYSGFAMVILQCHKNQAQYNISLHYDNTPQETDLQSQESINPTDNNWDTTLDPRNWASTFGSMFGGAIGNFFGATGAAFTWWQHLIMWIEIIVIIVVAVFIIVFSIRVLRMIMPRFRMSKWFKTKKVRHSVNLNMLKKTL